MAILSIHSGYTLNDKCQKCTGMSLNDFILKTMNKDQHVLLPQGGKQWFLIFTIFEETNLFLESAQQRWLKIACPDAQFGWKLAGLAALVLSRQIPGFFSL